MLGKPLSVGEQRNITPESNVTNDIIKEYFMDTYTNVTIKSVALLKWATTYCAQANFLF